MYHYNPFYNNPHYVPPPLPAPSDLQSTVHGATAMHPPPHPYNTDWGPEHEVAFFQNINQTSSGQSSTTGHVPATSNYQCKWALAGGPCNQQFDTFDDLVVHAARDHDVQGTASRKLVCQWLKVAGICGKKYRRDGYRRHIATHVGCSVPCTECGKSFSRSDSLRAHAKKLHGQK